jgi:hypothetical protein
VKARTFAEAKRIKISKIYRAMGHVEARAFKSMKASTSHRMPVRHRDAVAGWRRVISRIDKLKTIRAAKALLG